MPVLTVDAARAAVTSIPAHKCNDNCVQDAQCRLRDALKLASHFHTGTDIAPSYVARAVADLQSWLDLA